MIGFTSCPCCKSNTCEGRRLFDELTNDLERIRCNGGQDRPWDDVSNEISKLRRERDRYKRAFDRQRIVIELLAKYPEEDEHGR